MYVVWGNVACSCLHRVRRPRFRGPTVFVLSHGHMAAMRAEVPRSCTGGVHRTSSLYHGVVWGVGASRAPRPQRIQPPPPPPPTRIIIYSSCGLRSIAWVWADGDGAGDAAMGADWDGAGDAGMGMKGREEERPWGQSLANNIHEHHMNDV